MRCFARLGRAWAAVGALSLSSCAAGEATPHGGPSAKDGKATRPAPDPATGGTPRAQGDPSAVIVIGEVRHRGVATCPGADYGRRVWFAKTQLVGGTSIAAEGASFDALEEATRQAVIVRGTKSTESPAPYGEAPADAGECPLMQMRSDWTETPDGIEMDSDARTHVAPALAVAAVPGAVERFSGATTRVRDDGTLEVSLSLAAELASPASMSLTLHYEGCYGKPGHHAEVRTPTMALGPGGASTWTEAFAPLWTDKDGSGKFERHHAPHRLHWRGEADGLVVDLVLPVEGYTQACDAVKGERRKQAP